MRRFSFVAFVLICGSVGGFAGALLAAPPKAAEAPAPPPPPGVVFPLERTAYFVKEEVPLAFRGVADGAAIKLEATLDGRTTLLYAGPARPIWLSTSQLATGDYALALDGTPTGQRLTITPIVRRSAGSMQDEASPAPQPRDLNKLPPAERPAAVEKHWDDVAKTFRESGLTGVVAVGSADHARFQQLDVMARSGALLLVNPDTRPTSFFPTSNLPAEIDGMSRRMILTAQANGMFPNFGGFCFGWDTTGYAQGNRKGLMTYWGWGKNEPLLRAYINRVDTHVRDEFTRRTGLKPVTESEYIAYLLSIGRADLAPAIDLPTKVWLEEIADHTKPMNEPERVAFERRLDAWSSYLMGMYHEVYHAFKENLQSINAGLRNTSSVQIDHAAVRYGQYWPKAHESLDLHYQSTWNDQVGGPDYAYQWLLTAGLLDMHRGEKPTWLSTVMGPIHGRAAYPGKLMKAAAHGLPWGASGIGFALEGFTNLLGGLNGSQSAWPNIQGQAGEADVRAGREFLDRFAALAVAGRGDHRVGILFSKSQYQRQHAVLGFGQAPYLAFVTLTRLGYTPRFVTEEDLAAGRIEGLQAIVVVGQTFPLAEEAKSGLERFTGGGGKLLVDGGTTVALPQAVKLPHTFPFSQPGKPHSWSSPNMPRGENDSRLYAKQYPELANLFVASLGDLGRSRLVSERGIESQISLLQIDGGADAQYVVAVNDSFVDTQADWQQVREQLKPLDAGSAAAVLYDCTDERALGPTAVVDCDLTAQTARVYGILSKAATLVPAANQKREVGDDVPLSVTAVDAGGAPLQAVVPFCVTLNAPDGRTTATYFRSTDRTGKFAMEVPTAVNEMPGEWKVTVRSQLDGRTATLPVELRGRVGAVAYAAPATEAVVVRNRGGLHTALHPGAKFVLPVFDNDYTERLVPVAEKIKSVLEKRGVEVELRVRPVTGTYTLSYDATPEELAANAEIDAGKAFGKIKRTTANGNDWFAAVAGYQFGSPVIVVDLVGQQDDKGKPIVVNPLSDGLAKPGLLWPKVTEEFPGPGKAVVQAIAWAFAPRKTAIVLQATDEAGLLAAAESLADLPPDRFVTAGIRHELWAQYHVGSHPSAPAGEGLTSTGLQTGQAAQPLQMRFGTARPPKPEEVPPQAPVERLATAVPGTALPAQFVPYYRDNAGRMIETATVGPLVPDMRFHEAVWIAVEPQQSGKVKLIVDGLFRYSDRKPMWQAQWEDIIELRERTVPRDRKPMEYEVRLRDPQGNEKVLGKLLPAKTEEAEVKLELAAPSAGLKPRTAVEEVVTRLAGEIELPAGRSELLLVHKNIVDGKLAAIGLGQEPVIPPPPPKK